MANFMPTDESTLLTVKIAIGFPHFNQLRNAFDRLIPWIIYPRYLSFSFMTFLKGYYTKDAPAKTQYLIQIKRKLEPQTEPNNHSILVEKQRKKKMSESVTI